MKQFYPIRRELPCSPCVFWPRSCVIFVLPLKPVLPYGDKTQSSHWRDLGSTVSRALFFPTSVPFKPLITRRLPHQGARVHRLSQFGQMDQQKVKLQTTWVFLGRPESVSWFWNECSPGPSVSLLLAKLEASYVAKIKIRVASGSVASCRFGLRALTVVCAAESGLNYTLPGRFLWASPARQIGSK